MVARSRWLGFVVAGTILASGALAAGDWAHWRGPTRDGASAAGGLPESWSAEGENLLWRVDFIGRSTPVVLGSKVCANGRAGEGEMRQEMVACFDVESGDKLWEHRFNVYHTSVPWTRVGWANPTGDPETGYLYVQGVGGLFFCLDSADGRIVWSRNLIEEFGFMEGYGGRTQTPIVDEDRLIVTFANTSWGAEGRPLHRLRAFDKRTGEQLWVSSPASSHGRQEHPVDAGGGRHQRRAARHPGQRRRLDLRGQGAHRRAGLGLPAQQARHQHLGAGRRHDRLRQPQRGERRRGDHGPGRRDRRHGQGRRDEDPRDLAGTDRRRLLFAGSRRRQALRRRQLGQPARARRRRPAKSSGSSTSAASARARRSGPTARSTSPRSTAAS